MNIRALLFGTAVLFSVGTPLSAQEEMYAARRQALMRSMDGGSAVLFSDATSGEFNKHFFYLTGIKDPGVALVLVPGADVEEVLFNRSGEWGQASRSHSARAHQVEEMPSLLPTYTRGRVGARGGARSVVHASFRSLGALSGLGPTLSGVSTIENLDNAIATLRIIKDRHEIEFLRQACRVTAEGLNDVFRTVEAGMQEEELSVLLEFGFKMRKSPGFSFLQAASGPNGTNVHFGAGERYLEDGDLIVFDVGAVWNDYTADISRTIPVSGNFTKEQREIYTVVLNAQKAAIRLMKPGAEMGDVRQAAQDALIDGLHELGLVLDPGNEGQRRFFIAHGYYHFIGLDIHDVWSEFSRSSVEKVYQAGQVMTMEPGLYFPEDRLDSVLESLGSSPEESEFRTFLESIRPVYEKYIDIGVRIEDDVLITSEGNEVLTAGVPKEIDAIEEMMREPGLVFRSR